MTRLAPPRPFRHRAAAFAAAALLALAGPGPAAAPPVHAPLTAAPPADALPIAKDLTLSWFVPIDPQAAVSIRSYAEQSAYQVLAERTGIRVAFQHPPIGAEAERFSLLTVSGKYPDVIEYDWSVYPGGPAKALKDGVIVPLNALIARHAPNLSALLAANPALLREISTDDGTIYAFPSLVLDLASRNVWGPQIRADWLDQAGLATPTTLAQWEQALRAFQRRQSAGGQPVYPYSAYSADGEPAILGLPQALTVFLGGFGMTAGTAGFYQSGGRVHYAPAEPAYRDFLIMLRRWYADGLLDPDLLTQNIKRFDTKMIRGQIGAYAGFSGGGMGRYTAAARTRLPGFRLVAAPFPVGGEGRRYITQLAAGRASSPSASAISSQNRHMVETVRFLDYGYSTAGGLALNFGREGVSYTLVKGEPRYTDALLHDPRLSVAEAIMRHARPRNGPRVQDPRYLVQFYKLPEQRAAIDTWAQGSTELLLPPISVASADARKYAALMGDINTYVAEMTAKFILGREPLSRFDDYRQALRSAGMDRAIGYMQAALDRYNAKPAKFELPAAGEKR